MSSKFIHVVAYFRISFLLRLSNIPFYFYTTFCLPVHVHEHLGCFYLLAIVRNAAMSMDVQKPIQVPVFSYFGYIHQSGIAESYSNSV